MKTRLLCRGLVAPTVILFVLGCAACRAQAREHAATLENNSSRPSRLIVQINNVADENKSRRNEVELFVNGKKIKPSGASESLQRDRVFELALASGVHKIHAVYRAQSFWKEKEFRITTHDGRVRLYPDYTTFLSIALEKKSDGALTREKNFFSETPRLTSTSSSISEVASAAQSSAPVQTVELVRTITTQPLAEKQEDSAAEARALVIAPIAPRPLASIPNDKPKQGPELVSNAAALENSERELAIVSLDRAAVPSEAPKANEAPVIAPTPVAISRAVSVIALAGKVALQINTVPANADVFVDDKFLGQSPLVTRVDRGRSHVIQISKKGYAEKIKLLDRDEFGNQQTYFLIEKLEKEE